MKKHLLKLGAAAIALTLAVSVSAQDFAIKTANVGLAPGDAAPTIDGVADDMWAGVSVQDITVAYGDETVSLTASPTWQAVWDDNAMYIIVTTPDDDYLDYKTAGVGGAWLADLVELYFDVNATKVDNNGPNPNDEANYPSAGHIQIAINEPDGNTRTDGVEWGFVVTDDKVIVNEYKVPFSALQTNQSTDYDPYGQPTIGFDITIIDLDEDGVGANTTLGRVNYSNNTVDAVEGGRATESWNCLDQSADITFVEEVVPPVGIIAKNSNVNFLVSTVVADEIEFTKEVSNICVTNTLGQVVAKDANVSSLNAGVYLVTVEVAGKKATNKIYKK